MPANIALLQNELAALKIPFAKPRSQVIFLLRIQREVILKIGYQVLYWHLCKSIQLTLKNKNRTMPQEHSGGDEIYKLSKILQIESRFYVNPVSF